MTINSWTGMVPVYWRRVIAELGTPWRHVTVPTRYVVASGTSLGSRGDEQERIRASLDGVCARNPNIQVSAKVTSNHGAILNKDSTAIARAVREVATLDSSRSPRSPG